VTPILRLKGRGFVDQMVIASLDERWNCSPSEMTTGCLPSGDALRSLVLSRLPEGERKVLEALIAAYPSSVEETN